MHDFEAMELSTIDVVDRVQLRSRAPGAGGGL
jgi:hypothetical protein